MEIIEDRHGRKSTIISSQNKAHHVGEHPECRKSTIISSQLPVSSWYEVIGESTIADYHHFFIMRSIS